jgi:hypothetical protein
MATKQELMDRADKARRKAKEYASEERVNRVFESNTPTPFAPDYKSRREAASAMANMYESEAETLKTRAANSREQYNYEKKQGGPMTDLSYEEWKKLD